MKLKRMMMVAVMAFATTLSLMADTETIGGYTWTYRISGDTSEIYNGGNVAVSPNPTGTLVIPSSLGGKPVTGIGEKAFYNCSGLTSVTIPDGVTSVGTYAFCICSGLKSLVLPDSVESVGSYAFHSCRGLVEVVLGDGLASVGDSAFDDSINIRSVTVPQYVCEKGLSTVFSSYNYTYYTAITNVTLTAGATNVSEQAFNSCSGVRSFAVSEGNPSYKAVNGCLLTKDGKTLVHGVNGSVTVPDGVEAIGAYAFYGRSNLTGVGFPESLRSIGANAFCICSGLKSLVLPDSVESVGSYAFHSCRGLVEVVLGDGLASVGDSAFDDSINIRSVTVPQYVCEKGLSTVFSSYNYTYYTAITNVTLTAGVTNIGANVFNNCSGLTSITIPAGVTSVGNKAFNGCTNLRTITLLGDVFSGVENLPWSTLGQVYYSIAYLNNWEPVFEQYDVEEEVMALELLDYDIMEETVDGKKWRYFANEGGAVIFSGGFGAAVSPVSVGEELTIPETLGGLPVVEIGFAAFKGLSGLAKVDIPSTVTNIADYAFYGCSALTNIVIPVSVLSIGNRAFAYCSKLTQVEFATPSALTSVGNAAFRGCESMDVETFALPDSVEHVGKGALLFVLPKTLGGTINGSLTLSQGAVYIVSNSVTVASGATLTVPPGTILKFNSGCSLTVSSGATLDAIGTRAQPIVFTSLKDDEHGDDTNDDGDETYPDVGDWYQIRVSGSANFNYCHVLYNSSTANYGAVEAYGGTVNFDNSEIAHTKYECVNAHSSGNFTARNSVFRDSSLGFGYYGSGRVKAYNCVFSDLTVAVRQSGKTLTNCAFYRCLAFTDQGGDGSTYSHCVFFNPSGYGAHSYSKCGSNGNVWGNPLFEDSDNDDIGIAFRVAANSPCVDAADVAVAPEYDYYGQPRDGAPDIGIYEAVSPYTDRFDIVPIAVAATASTASPGDKLTICWTVNNRGKLKIEDSWRDAISLLSENGDEVPLGESVVTGTIVPGGKLEWSDNFVVPPVAEGIWRVKVNANAHQDVVEGAARLNNALVSVQGVMVTVPTVMASGASGTVAAGGRTIVKIPFDSDDTTRMVRVSVASGAMVSWGFGFVPQSISSASGSAVSSGAGVAFLAPDGANAVYLVIESASATEWTLQTDSSRIAIVTVEPSELPSSGMATVAINGAGFTPMSTVSFTGSATVSSSSVTYVSPDRILATVDCGMLTAETKYGVSVSDGVSSAGLHSAVAVQPAPPKPNLVFSIETPSNVRRGRVATGFIEWRNTGNAEALAPIVTVKASRGTGLSLAQDGEYLRSVRFVGIGNSAPVGKVMPGEGGRQYFYFMPGSGSYKISYSVLGDGCTMPRGNSVFATWRDFATGVSDAATRMGLAGHATSDFMRLRDLANKTALGFNSAIMSGTLVSDVLSRPMAGRTVTLMDASGTAIASATTDKDGSFAFFDVVKSTGLSVGAEDVDGMRSIAVDTSTGDSLGVEIRSSLRPIVGSVVSVGYDRQAGATIELLSNGMRLDSAIADDNGEFAFWGVTNENCVLSVPAFGVCGSAQVEIGGEAFSGQVVLPYAGRIEGSVSFESGDAPPANLPLMLVDATGGSNAVTYAAMTDASGRFYFAGLPEGEYQLTSIQRYASTFADVKVSATAGKAVAIEITIPSPVPFGPSIPVCFAPGEVAFIIDDDAVLSATAFKWDFNADGVVDSTAIAPTGTYSTAGTYDVILQAQGADGKWTTYRYPSCVEVRGSVPTVLNANVRALSAKSIRSVVASDNEIVVDGATGADVSEGDVIVVPFSDGPAVVKVAAVRQTPDGAVLKVGYAEVTEVFKSASAVISSSSVEEWVVGKLKELLPEVENRCPYRAFDWSYDVRIDGDRYAITITPGVEGSVALEVSDNRISLAYVQVGVTAKVAFDFDFNADVAVTIPVKERKIPLGNFPAGPIPMTAEGKASIGGSLKAGWDGHWNYTTPTARLGGFVKWGENAYPPYVGLLPIIKASQSFDMPPFSVGFEVTGNIGVDVGAGFNIKAVKVKALAIGLQAGLTGSYERKLMDDYTSDEGQFRIRLGGDLTITPFEAEVWKASIAVLPQTIPLVDGWNHPFKPSYSAIPKIISATIDADGNAKISTGVDWKDTTECEYTEIVDWGDDSSPDTDHFWWHSHKYDTKGKSDRSVMTVTVTQKYNSLLSRDKKAKTTLVLNPQKCKCSSDCTECDGHCGDDCQCGSGGDGGGDGSSDGKEVISQDPNEMVGEDGIGDARYVKPGQELTYTIYFENKTNATAAAQEVRVTNPLSEWLDWNTFEMREVAFNNQSDLGLSGYADGTSEVTMNGTNLLVRTEVLCDVKTGAVNWYLRIVDSATLNGWPTDATAGFLPANDPDSHCGEGHITYRIKVRDDAPSGVVITNSASIVFDLNAPIETDPAWWNTVGRQDWIDVETNFVGGAKGTVTSKTDAKTGVTTLTAKPGNKNSIFAYWIGPEGEKAGFGATLKVNAATQGGKYTAVFTTKAACAAPSLDKSAAFAKGGATMFNSVVGVAASDRFVVPDECYPVKFSVKGMPTGLKVNATSGAITGVPTKAGKFTAVVTVTSVANAKKKVTVKVPITIAKLPKWTYGTFTGLAVPRNAMHAFEYGSLDEDELVGSATLTIGSTGKISLKVSQGGTNWTASATGFAASSDCTNELYSLSLTGKVKIGKKTYSRPFALALYRQSEYEDANGGPTLAIDSAVDMSDGSSDGEIYLKRYMWKDTGAAAMLASYAGAYTYYTSDSRKLTVTVAANGTAKATGTLANGRKLSLSTHVTLADGEQCVFLYAPAATVRIKAGKTTKTVKYEEFYERVFLNDYPSDPEPGSGFAYRNPGVRTPDARGEGSGTFAYSPAYGQAASNKTVTVTAKPASNSVFAFWADLDGYAVSYSPTCKVTMRGEDVTDLTAVFRLKSEYKDVSLEPWWENEEGNGIERSEVADILKWRLFTGKKTTLRLCVDDDVRPVKFTATGLPKGMSLNATTGVLSGIPTAASSGTVKITAACTADTKKKVTHSFAFTVRKLRTFAKGTFKGTMTVNYLSDDVDEDGYHYNITNVVEKAWTLTVGANGKASGKFAVGGKTYVLSSSCYSAYSDESAYTKDGMAGYKTQEDETFTASGTITCGSLKWPVTLTVRETGDMTTATKATRATDVNPKGYGAWKLDTQMSVETTADVGGLSFSSGLKRVK